VKGVELPINILVIVAIAVIVLLGLVALYFVGFNPFSTTAGLEGIKNKACQDLVQTNNCGVSTTTIQVNYDVNGDDVVGSTDTLDLLCSKYYSRTTEAACKGLCSCPGY
jgi:hypothetical protein